MEKLHFTHIQCLLVKLVCVTSRTISYLLIQYLGHVWRQLWTYKANTVMVDGSVDSWDHCGAWR